MSEPKKKRERKGKMAHTKPIYQNQKKEEITWLRIHAHSKRKRSFDSAEIRYIVEILELDECEW